MFDYLRIALLMSFTSGVTASGQPIADLHVTFDRDTAGVDAQGQRLEPVVQDQLEQVEGIRGQAVYVPASQSGEKGVLGYDAGKLFCGRGGTVMFWFRPDWSGDDYSDTSHPRYQLFYAADTSADAAEQERLRLFLWHQLRADFYRGKAEMPFSLHQGNQHAFTMGQRDWFHVALVWNDDGYSKFYLNGLPYNHADGARSWNLAPIMALANLHGVDRFYLGSSPGQGTKRESAGAAFDELRIYRQALDGASIADVYRQDNPLTIRLRQHFVLADQSEAVTVELAPFGHMEFPSPVAPTDEPVTAELTFSLYPFGSETPLASWQQQVRVSQLDTLELKLPPLKEGPYSLRCEANANGARHQRSFLISAYQPQSPVPASKEAIKVGEPLVVIDATKDANAIGQVHDARIVDSQQLGAYRETAEKNHSSIFFEFTVPEGFRDGQPMVIDLFWPDDKPRSFGLYLYPENTARPHHRDRLMGGIQSGEEYPVSDELRRERYLFFPWAGQYLFECRTLVEGMPGALSRIEVRPVEGRLPRLAVNRPAELDGRQFGVFDEDQTFEIIFNFDQDRQRPLYLPRVLDQVLDYLDYVGQDQLSYQLMRYDYIRYDIPGALQNIRNLRSAPGFFPLMLDMFAGRDKSLLAGIDIYTLPESSLEPEKNAQRLKDGYFQIDAAGKVIKPRVGYGRPNLFHPDAEASFFRHFKEILRRYGEHPGFAGFNLWATDIFWAPDGGYSDYTISLFEADTGIVIEDGEGDDRFAKRKAILENDLASDWYDWRARKVAQFLSHMTVEMQAVNPGLKLYLGLPRIEQQFPAGWQHDVDGHFYEDALARIGFDLDQLVDIPNLVIMPVRIPTMSRWQQHRTGALTNLDAFLASQEAFALIRHSGLLTATAGYYRFFESYQRPIRHERFGSYFQNADVKPHGRFFLKELADSMVLIDPETVLIGGQPFATLGRDDVSREFAAAYGALPAVAFEDIDGSTDPVTGRMAQAGGDTWIYFVNRTWEPLDVQLKAATKAVLNEIANDQRHIAENGLVTISLKPYELKSLRADGKLGKVTLLPSDSTELDAYFSEQLAVLDAMLTQAHEQGLPVDAAEKTIAALEQAAVEGRYAEAHRLRFSLPVRELLAAQAALASGFVSRRQEMLSTGHLAINLGTSGYFEADDGKLFLPDQAYESGSYGYLGPDKTVSRLTDDIAETDYPELFKSERYNMTNYRIDLPDGAYRIRTYQKIGYEPNRAPGKVVFGIKAEGRALAPVEDMFEVLEGDGGAVLVRDYDPVEIVDGTLELDFIRPETTDVSVPFLNAIEIIPMEHTL